MKNVKTPFIKLVVSVYPSLLCSLHVKKCHVIFVQGGEDLRQDQRLQQAFEIVNHLFRRDPGTAQRQLRLKTYAVVPLTTRVGMLQWVDNCMSFQVTPLLSKDSHYSLKSAQLRTYIFVNWF